MTRPLLFHNKADDKNGGAVDSSEQTEMVAAMQNLVIEKEIADGHPKGLVEFVELVKETDSVVENQRKSGDDVENNAQIGCNEAENPLLGAIENLSADERSLKVVANVKVEEPQKADDDGICAVAEIASQPSVKWNAGPVQLFVPFRRSKNIPFALGGRRRSVCIMTTVP